MRDQLMTNKKSKNSKEKILNSAIYLFSQKSFADVSIRDIAKEAAVSPALIYKYFDNQQHLHMTALKIEAKKLISELNTAHSLEQLVETYLHHMYKKDMLYQMMAYSMLEMRSTQKIATPLEETIEIIKMFEAALPKHFSTNRKQQAQLLFSTLNGLLITYKNYPSYSEEKAFKHILLLSNEYISLLTK